MSLGSFSQKDVGHHGAVIHTIQELCEKRNIMAFKNTFVRLRKQHSWTQQQVAEQVGLSVGQIKKYEKGTSAPTLHILGKIALMFGVSTDDLVFENGANVAAHKLDAELLKRFEQLADLPQKERDAVLLLIDSVIAKQTLRQIITS